MNKWVWVFLIFIVFTLSGLGWLYQFGGLKFYLKAASYVRSHPDTMESFYGPSGKKTYAGILAGVWGDGVAMWGESGLRYFPATSSSTYNALIGCKKLKMASPELGVPMTQSLNSDYGNAKSWGMDAKTGDMAFVVYTDELVPKIKQAWSVNYWMFENSDIKTQCLRDGGVK